MNALLLIMVLCGDADGLFRSRLAPESEQNAEPAAVEKPLADSEAEPESGSDDRNPVTVQLPPMKSPPPMATPPKKPLAWVANPPKDEPQKPVKSNYRGSGIWLESPPRAERRRNLVLLLPEDDPRCWKSPGVMADQAAQFKSNDIFNVIVDTKRYESARSYPCMFNPASGFYHYGDSMRSWDALIADINDGFDEIGELSLKVSKPKGFLRGSIPREVAQPLLDFFAANPNGRMTLDLRDEDNRPKVWKFVSGMFSALVGPDAEFAWKTTGGVTTVVCVKPVPVGLELVKRQMSGLVVTQESITLGLVLCPDYVLEIE